MSWLHLLQHHHVANTQDCFCPKTITHVALLKCMRLEHAIATSPQMGCCITACPEGPCSRSNSDHVTSCMATACQLLAVYSLACRRIHSLLKGGRLLNSSCTTATVHFFLPSRYFLSRPLCRLRPTQGLAEAHRNRRGCFFGGMQAA